MFHEVLTIVDGSPTSDYGVGASITIARELGSHISFCLTLDPMLRREEAGMMPFAELAFDLKHKMLRDAMRRAEEAGVGGSTGEIISDDVVSGIVGAAHARDASIIVMGLAPRTGILRPFMRNIALGILLETSVPLCVVRRPARGFLRRRILVPIADDELADTAILAAIDMAQQFHSTLIFCSLANEAEQRFARDAVERGSTAASAAGVPSASLAIVPSGTISNSIAHNAAIHDCDSIVMATHARQGLPRLIEGSVAAAVVAQSDIPVVVVRRPD